MAFRDVEVSGKVRQDGGDGVNGITVYLLHTDAGLDGTQETTTTTNSDGTWTFTETSRDVNYDIKIVSGSQVRYIPWSDEIALKTVDASVMKVRGASDGAAAPLYLFADLATDAGDSWRIQATDSDTLTIGSDKAVAGTIIDYITITNGANAAASTVTIAGTLDVNGTVDWDVTDVQVDSSGDIDLVSTNDAAAAIYLHENAGTSGTIKIHADQGTSATEGSASIQLLSDAGGINLKSGLNGAGAVLLTADGGTSETIVIHADQGTGTGSIELLSDAGGIELDAGTDIILDAGGADIFLKDDGTLFGTLTNSGGELVIKSSSSGTTAATFAGANVTFAGAVQIDGAVTVGVDDTGLDVKFFGATAGSFLLWDESDDALELTDSSPIKIGDGGDMTIYHDGSNSYITNATGALKLATETSGIAVTIGHSTSEVTIADNLTVSGNLTVTGTQTIVDTVTMNAANAVVFEGATADAHETTLTIIDPTTDRTVYVPNQSGYLPVLAAASTTQISATPEELNVLDGVTAGTVSANLGVVVDGSKDIGTFGTVTAGNFTVGTLVITDDTLTFGAAASIDYTGNLYFTGTLATASDSNNYQVRFNEVDSSVTATASNTGTGTSGYAFVVIDAETIAAASSYTFTEASTFMIAGPPAAGTNMTLTNPYAMHVVAGKSRFGGDLLVNGDLDFTGAQEISTSSGDLTIAPASDIIFNQGGNEIGRFEAAYLGYADVLKLTGMTSGDDTELLINALSGQSSYIEFIEAGTWMYILGYDAANNRFKITSTDTDGSGANADIIRIPDGQLTVDFNATADDSAFDDYDDVAVLEAAYSPTSAAYDLGSGILKRGKELLADIGVLKRYEDDWFGYNPQRMDALLAGGIYQTRDRIKTLEERIAALEKGV